MRTHLDGAEIAITQQELEFLSAELTKAINYLGDVSFLPEYEDEIPTLVGRALGTLKYAKVSADVILDHIFSVK